MSEAIKSKPLKLDAAAESADSKLPAFLARPESAPVYHGFTIIPETMTDGWCFGAITECVAPEGCDYGDAFVVAPDGSRAGLVWEVGRGEPSQILAPDDKRWGVYQIWFSKPIKTTVDLVECFKEVLPHLKKIHQGQRPKT